MTKLIKGEEGYKQGKKFDSEVQTRSTEIVGKDMVRYRYYYTPINNEGTEIDDGVMYLAARYGARIRPCLAEILEILDKPENASITHAEFEFNEIDIKVRRGDDVYELISWYEEVYDFMRKMSKIRNATSDKGVGV